MELNEEQTMLADTVARFVGDRYETSARMTRLAAGLHFDPAIWREFAQLGLLGLAVPESSGGLGCSAVETAIVMQAFGRGLVLEPYLASAVQAGTALLAAGDGRRDGHAALLAEMAAGTAVPVVAFAEPASRYDLRRCRTVARASGERWILDGHKCVVPGGAHATHFIVPARTSGQEADPDGLTLFVVHRESPGLARVDYPTMDGRPACDLHLHGVELSSAARLGAAGAGGKALARSVDAALAASLAEAVGAMDQALAITLEYLKTRQQFGRPLSANQALQHRLVDMHIAIEESRVMAFHAARAIAVSTHDEASQVVSAAKVLVGRAMRLVGQEAVQMHGAIGTTYEAPISHYFKRLTALRMEYGDADWHAGLQAEAIRRAPGPDTDRRDCA